MVAFLRCWWHGQTGAVQVARHGKVKDLGNRQVDGRGPRADIWSGERERDREPRGA